MSTMSSISTLSNSPSVARSTTSPRRTWTEEQQLSEARRKEVSSSSDQATSLPVHPSWKGWLKERSCWAETKVTRRSDWRRGRGVVVSRLRAPATSESMWRRTMMPESPRLAKCTCCRMPSKTATLAVQEPTTFSSMTRAWASSRTVAGTREMGVWRILEAPGETASGSASSAQALPASRTRSAQWCMSRWEKSLGSTPHCLQLPTPSATPKKLYLRSRSRPTESSSASGAMSSPCARKCASSERSALAERSPGP
mmetsp:Transcript_30409/g.69625  ORF Transcript_30409/g.69625 Transcript_30409/m.69625 type:complete len:255 (-) Transcript_30409:93-857(-)